MLSWSQFESEAVQFVERVGGGWEFIVTAQSRPGGAYLVCRNNARCVSAGQDAQSVQRRDDHEAEAVATEEEEEEEDPDDCLVVSDGECLAPGGTEVHVYDYFVVYSATYQVPVLYFQASHLDGRMLTWAEVWADVPSRYRDEDIRWNFITQQEHPVTGTPCFHIHPCETKALMTNLTDSGSTDAHHTDASRSAGVSGTTSSNNNYLMAWLSAVGPVVGLRLPLTAWMPVASASPLPAAAPLRTT